MKSHLDNDSCLPIYKTNLAICDTPHQTHYVGNSIFPHFVVVMTVLWAELWFVVECRALFFFWRGRRNQTLWAGPRQPSLYSTRFLENVFFLLLMLHVLRYVSSGKFKFFENAGILSLALVNKNWETFLSTFQRNFFLLDHYLRDFVLKDKLPYIHRERTKVLVLNFFESAGILSLALVNKNLETFLSTYKPRGASPGLWC